jgi:hypothetical protein
MMTMTVAGSAAQTSFRYGQQQKCEACIDEEDFEREIHDQKDQAWQVLDRE